MSRYVEKRPAVYGDLLTYFVHIGERNLAAAKRFLRAAEDTFDFLATSPELGAKRPIRRVPTLRMFPVRDFPKYLVFYRPADYGIEVVRVLHASRNLQALLSRER